MEGVFYGMGAYAPERARHERPAAASAPRAGKALGHSRQSGGAVRPARETYKRLKLPDDLPEALRPLYVCKSYYWERSLPFGRACSPELAADIAAGFQRLQPLYAYLTACTPEEEDYL